MFTVIAYRKICKADRKSIETGGLLPKRFELCTNLTHDDAHSIFQVFTESPQILAVELYDNNGLIKRHDLLIELTREDASQFEFAKACHSFN